VHGRRQARILGARRALSPGELADPSFDLKAYRREVPLPAYGGRRRMRGCVPNYVCAP